MNLARPGTDNGRRGGSALRLGVPFFAVHLGALAVVFVGWSAVSVAVAFALYAVRALGVTVFYHRGLAHHAFRMGRVTQAVGATVAASAAQRGPLWWVSHHRAHHRRTDRAGDPHSPVVDGMGWSHLWWMFAPANQAADLGNVLDLRWQWELRLLDRYHHVAPGVLAAATFAAGMALGRRAPGLGVNGPQLLVWGFCISTVFLWHATFAVNSLGHATGSRRFETRDASRNLWWLAWATMGEGWHNNHHRYPASARQGLRRSELDPSWWLIRTMAILRLASELRTPRPATPR